MLKVVPVVKLTPQGERVEFSLLTFVPTGHPIRHPVKISILDHDTGQLTPQENKRADKQRGRLSDN